MSISGNKLTYWRSKKAMTVRELSEKSGVAASTISRLETGKQKAFPSTLGKLALALDIDPTELEELADQGEPVAA